MLLYYIFKQMIILFSFWYYVRRWADFGLDDKTVDVVLWM